MMFHLFLVPSFPMSQGAFPRLSKQEARHLYHTIPYLNGTHRLEDLEGIK